MPETYTYPSGFALKYVYNSRGDMNHISGFFGSYWAGLWTGYAQNQHRQWTQYQTPAGLTTLQYDNFGFPSQTVSQNGLGSTAQDLRYQFNSTTGNLSWRRDALKNFREDFTYDGDLHSRLTGWSVNGQPVAAMQYLSNGNISQKTDVSTAPASYRYEHPQGKPHAVTSVAQPTTAFLNAAPEQNITYTPFNKVSFISDTYLGRSYELDITYGPDQQRKYSRLEEDEGVGMPLTTETYFLDQYETKRMLPSTEQKIHYLSGPTGLFGIMVQTGSNMQLYYVLTDYLGSITGITDASGNVLEKLSYDPWGRRRNPNNWTDYTVQPSRFDRGYTSHEHLDQFGLINMNGRVYDPFLARFLSPDPFVQAPEYSQNYNRYSYAWNNPLKYTDPSGEFIHLIIGAAIGGIANWLANGAQFNAAGLGHFGVGALAGGLGAGIGAGFGALASGAGHFSFMSSAALGAQGFGAGAAVGFGTGFTGGMVTGTGNSLIQGQNIGKALSNGLNSGLWGGAIGGLSGGITGGIRAGRNGNNFWSGNAAGGKYGNVPQVDVGRMNYGKQASTLSTGSRSKLNSLVERDLIWKKYLEVGSGVSSKDVYSKIGGEVYSAYLSSPSTYQNSCTLRLSYALNETGFKLPERITSLIGARGDNYYLTVNEMNNYFSKLLGTPTIGSSASDIIGQRGIILFEFGSGFFSNATGHISLFDGYKVAYGNYFGTGSYKFWPIHF